MIGQVPAAAAVGAISSPALVFRLSWPKFCSTAVKGDLFINQTSYYLGHFSEREKPGRRATAVTPGER
jgi:hypothetical protein